MKRIIKFRAWGTDGDDSPRMWNWDEISFVFDLWLADENSYIMQYTGIQDSLGKEIYEGDIVEIEYYPDLPTTKMMDSLIVKTVCQYYNNMSAGFYLEGMSGHYYAVGYAGSAVKRKKVIGNVFENPDLFLER